MPSPRVAQLAVTIILPLRRIQSKLHRAISANWEAISQAPHIWSTRRATNLRNNSSKLTDWPWLMFNTRWIFWVWRAPGEYTWGSRSQEPTSECLGLSKAKIYKKSKNLRKGAPYFLRIGLPNGVANWTATLWTSVAESKWRQLRTLCWKTHATQQ